MSLSLAKKTLLALLFLRASLASPLVSRQSAGDDGQSVDKATCVAIYAEDSHELATFSGASTPLSINSIALPDAGYLSIHESEDDDPEDDFDPNPDGPTVDAAAAAGIDPSKYHGTGTTHDKRDSVALYERSGTRRLFQASNYRYCSLITGCCGSLCSRVLIPGG